MKLLLLIIVDVIVPVFSLIGIGAFLHRMFSFDLNTLSKLTTYFLLPAVIFTNMYESNMEGHLLFIVIGFLVVHNLILMIAASGVTKIRNMDKRLEASFKNSMVLNNSGNFGLPVSQLVFAGNPIGLSVGIVVSIFQNLLTYTYGLFNSLSSNGSISRAFIQFLKLPTIYALLLGFGFNALSIQLPLFLWSPIQGASNAFLAIALITLGAQSAYLKLSAFSVPLVLSLIGRLVVSPITAFIVILVTGLEGTIAQALFIASSFPTSRNSALFALEYNNHPEFAAQAVIVSTLFSMVTVTTVVYLSQVLY